VKLRHYMAWWRIGLQSFIEAEEAFKMSPSRDKAVCEENCHDVVS